MAPRSFPAPKSGSDLQFSTGKESHWWARDLVSLPPQIRRVFEEYSGLPARDVIPHIYRIASLVPALSRCKAMSTMHVPLTNRAASKSLVDQAVPVHRRVPLLGAGDPSTPRVRIGAEAADDGRGQCAAGSGVLLRAGST